MTSKFNRINQKRSSFVFSKKFGLAFILVIIIAVGAFVFKNISADQQNKPGFSLQNNKKSGENPKNNTIRLIAIGDLLPHETVNKNAKNNGSYDYRQFFNQVNPFIDTADITFCNQESPSAGGLPITGYPTFNAPPKFAEDLNDIGCNLINLANNHSFDKGQAGINGTLDTWNKLNTLAVTGINRNADEQAKIATFTMKGVKFSFLSYTYCSNNSAASAIAVNRLDKALVKTQIDQARQVSDMIIVGTHWCKENSSKEDLTQQQWAQYFADNDVDIVIGTGPHVLQPVKKLSKAGGGNTIIWFSLGNFLSTQEQINGLIGGIAVMDIDVTKKEVIKLGFLPTYMHYEWTNEQKSQNNLLARKNLMIYPLDQSAEPLSRSLNKTTVNEQMSRITALLNTYTEIQILNSNKFDL